MRTTAALFLVLGGSALAQTSEPAWVVAHHGRLLTGADQAFEGTVKMTFTIYERASHVQDEPDPVVWQGVYPAVEVTGGVYSVLLGDADAGRQPLTAAHFSAPRRYLAIKIGDDAEMSPRLRFGTAPYAISAASAEKALHADAADEAAHADAADEATHADAADEATHADAADEAAHADAADDATHADAADAADLAALAHDLDCANCVSAAELAGGVFGGDGVATTAARSDHSHVFGAESLGGAALVKGSVPLDRLDTAVSAASHTHTYASGSLDGSALAAGSVPLDRLQAAVSTPGHTHAAADVTSGQFGDARISDVDASKITGDLAVRLLASAPSSPRTGTLYFDTALGALRLWDGSAWRAVGSPGCGDDVTSPAASCQDIRTRCPSRGSGQYFITLGGTAPAFQAWCEMDIDGNAGGWTLCFADKYAGKGADTQSAFDFLTAGWDKGSRVFTRGNSDAGAGWGNFCPAMAAMNPAPTQIYAVSYGQSGTRYPGTTCAFNPAFFQAGNALVNLGCTGSTKLCSYNKPASTNSVQGLRYDCAEYNEGNNQASSLNFSPGGGNDYPNGTITYTKMHGSCAISGGDQHCTAGWCYECSAMGATFNSGNKKTLLLYMR